MSTYYILGFIVGMAVVAAALVLLIIMFCRKKFGFSKSKYDERQKISQGKAYRDGFWSLLGSIGLVLLLIKIDDFAEHTEMLIITACFIGLMVYVAECTMRDAYMGLNDDPKRWTIVLAVIGVLNMVIAISNGKNVNWEAVWLNILCVLLVLSAIIPYAVRKLITKKEVEGDQ